jgi:hypothetical protein
MSRTVTRRLCGHLSGGPSEVLDQSNARVDAPISPPPARKSLTGSFFIDLARQPLAAIKNVLPTCGQVAANQGKSNGLPHP